ncbi:LAQU0S06e04324g1_1 [Lachancea quebecensis]|uniref:LAQU0S06e04324g1_1 n=1 Tax=Lachancea quebecensis TaxID=1654605 RepID=A0A0P1KU83_9SACH|nr:LAQU0S06e04324g1_1 [Lachancea quebecensis]
MIDLSLVLGKHVTFPLLCYVSYLLYRDLTAEQNAGDENAVPAGDKHAEASTKDHLESTIGAKWSPIPLMKEQVVPIASESDYRPWNETKPYPYKPFKAGEYRLNMGVKPIPVSNWLVIENTYKERIEAKWEIIKHNYKDVMFCLDPAMVNSTGHDGTASVATGDAAFSEGTLVTLEDVNRCLVAVCELYDHVIGYLCQRFPQYFEVVLSPSSESAGVIHSKIMNEFHPVDPRAYLELENDSSTFIQYCCKNTDIVPSEVMDSSVKKDNVGYRSLVTTTRTRRAHELILAMARMVEEDKMLLLPNASGQFNNEYILMAGCFAFAAGFNPRERFLKPLTLVHGPVPDYKKNLQAHMNRFFHTHQPGKLVLRLNFSFQTHTKLYVTDDNKGADGELILAKTLDQLRGGRDLFYRSERQCLIKLGPSTNAMCFSIKTYLWSMTEQFLTDEFYSRHGVLQDLYDAVAGMQENVSHYKRKPEWGPALLGLLQKRLKAN